MTVFHVVNYGVTGFEVVNHRISENLRIPRCEFFEMKIHEILCIFLIFQRNPEEGRQDPPPPGSILKAAHSGLEMSSQTENKKTYCELIKNGDKDKYKFARKDFECPDIQPNYKLTNPYPQKEQNSQCGDVYTNEDNE